MSAQDSNAMPSTVQARLADALADANGLRAAGLSAWEQFAQARTDSLQLEQLRLTAKYGAEAEATRRIARQVDASVRLQSAARVERSRSQVPVPKPDPNGCILYGMVLDGDSAPVSSARMTVSIGDRKEIITTRTDQQGGYVVTLPPQEGSPKLQVEIIDSGGHAVTFDDSFELRTGEVVYREFVI